MHPKACPHPSHFCNAPQEKALLVLAALLDSPHRARAAALLVQANGPAALQRLEAAWLQEAEAAAAEEDEDGGDSAYLHDLVALCRRVQRDVAAAAAAADDDGGGGAGAPSAALGGSVHDASEL